MNRQCSLLSYAVHLRASVDSGAERRLIKFRVEEPLGVSVSRSFTKKYLLLILLLPAETPLIQELRLSITLIHTSPSSAGGYLHSQGRLTNSIRARLLYIDGGEGVLLHLLSGTVSVTFVRLFLRHADLLLLAPRNWRRCNRSEHERRSLKVNKFESVPTRLHVPTQCFLAFRGSSNFIALKIFTLFLLLFDTL